MHYEIHCEMSEEFTRLVTKTMIELYEECKKDKKIASNKSNDKQ